MAQAIEDVLKQLAATREKLSFRVVTTYHDGTVLTPANEANYLGGLYNKGTDGAYVYLNNNAIWSTSRLKNSTDVLFRRLVSDLPNGGLIIVDTFVDLFAPTIIPANITLLITATGTINDPGGNIRMYGKTLGDYESLTGRPFVYKQNRNFNFDTTAFLNRRIVFDDVIQYGEPFVGAFSLGTDDSGFADPMKSMSIGLRRRHPVGGQDLNGIYFHSVNHDGRNSVVDIEFWSDIPTIRGSVMNAIIKGATGNVGIGITPEERLHVDGNIKGKRIIAEISILSVQEEPPTPPDGQVYEWWNGASKMAKFDDGTTKIIYSRE